MAKARGIHGRYLDDNISFLSISEIEKYFPEESDRCCYPTEYAISQNVYDRYKEEYKKRKRRLGSKERC